MGREGPGLKALRECAGFRGLKAPAPSVGPCSLSWLCSFRWPLLPPLAPAPSVGPCSFRWPLLLPKALLPSDGEMRRATADASAALRFAQHDSGFICGCGECDRRGWGRFFPSWLGDGAGAARFLRHGAVEGRIQGTVVLFPACGMRSAVSPASKCERSGGAPRSRGRNSHLRDRGHLHPFIVVG